MILSYRNTLTFWICLCRKWVFILQLPWACPNMLIKTSGCRLPEDFFQLTEVPIRSLFPHIMTSGWWGEITAFNSECQGISSRLRGKEPGKEMKGDDRESRMAEREGEGEGGRLRDVGYLSMQGRTDESLGSGCYCRCELKHLAVREEKSLSGDHSTYCWTHTHTCTL